MRIWIHALLAYLTLLAAPSATSAAPSLAIQSPSKGALGKSLVITYSGVSEPVEGAETLLAAYRELDGVDCAPNAYEQSKRLYARRAGSSRPPAGPFSLEQPITFMATGVWRICAYLTNSAGWADAPPVAFATSTITIAPAQSTSSKSCVVPQLRGLTVSKARAALKRRGCALGRVKRTRGARGGSGVVVKQEFKAGTRLPRGRPIDITVGSRR
jgi:hypothetical protein